MKVTRDVISDLWPVYEAREATADTRALVDEFLAQDPEFASMLRSEVRLPTPEAPLRPDVEVRSLARTRALLQGSSWLRGVRLLALAFTVFACQHAVTDTTFVVSPRLFIGNGIAAVVTWTVYGAWLARIRSNALKRRLE